jgi:hypothetical protein
MNTSPKICLKLACYVASDGFYGKINWVDGVTALPLDVISKLQCDADLRYVCLYRCPEASW